LGTAVFRSAHNHKRTWKACAAGSQFWGGVLDTHFWFDPTDLMTQVLPFLDDEFIFLYADFERAVYANLDQLKAAIRP